ncbi:N-acetylneuraminate synthase family protein [Candidatus Pelagibacter sp.]|nr:N-acetylneuraminate synthase family protein [Candidatus Pelagibacter sp.]
MIKTFKEFLIKPRIVAEVGQSHNGSIKKVFKIIDKLSKIGVDVVKFQTHLAYYESTKEENFRKGFNFKHKSRLDYWRANEFDRNQWQKIFDHCKKKKVIFATSPFSIQAYEMLKYLNPLFWKIGSGEFFSEDLIDKIVSDKQNIIISTGLSNWNEILEKISFFKKKKINFIVLQCTTKYPSNYKDIGINILDELTKKKCFTGLSDHSGSIYPSLLALAKNVSMIEVHVIDNKKKIQPDATSSLDFNEIKLLVEARDKFFTMNNAKINKDKVAKNLIKSKILFTKSASLKDQKPKGHIIKKKDIIFKKPGSGFGYKDYRKIVGKRLRNTLKENVLIKKKHLI